MEKIGTDSYVLASHGSSALLTGGKLILIDTGTQADGSKLIPEINAVGYQVKDIQSVILTHVHPDHVGGLAKIIDGSEARVASHEIEAKFISREETYDGPPGAATQQHPGTKVDDLLNDGQVYEGLLVIHTPGHTLGHIALLDQENDLHQAFSI